MTDEVRRVRLTGTTKYAADYATPFRYFLVGSESVPRRKPTRAEALELNLLSWFSKLLRVVSWRFEEGYFRLDRREARILRRMELPRGTTYTYEFGDWPTVTVAQEDGK